MKFSALSSGSSGNCFYVSNRDSAILIDAGISCKQIVEKLAYLGESPTKIRGIFVTHEHIDHTRGVDVFAREFNIPIYATKGTIKNSFLCSDENLINNIKNDETTLVGGMEVEAFSKAHDVSDPVSFRVSNGKTISVITDIGHSCENVAESISDSDFLVMEANHDLTMLENGPYPLFLKKRIASDVGHISNLHSGLAVLEHGKSRLKNVVLAHLSEKNNTPLMALSTFNSLIRERRDFHPKVSLSLRDSATLLFRV